MSVRNVVIPMVWTVICVVIDLWVCFSYIPATSLMLVSAQCKTAGHGPCQFWWGLGDWEHSLVKVPKLQCETAGHGPCLH